MTRIHAPLLGLAVLPLLSCAKTNESLERMAEAQEANTTALEAVARELAKDPNADAVTEVVMPSLAYASRMGRLRTAAIKKGLPKVVDGVTQDPWSPPFTSSHQVSAGTTGIYKFPFWNEDDPDSLLLGEIDAVKVDADGDPGNGCAPPPGPGQITWKEFWHLQDDTMALNTVYGEYMDAISSGGEGLELSEWAPTPGCGANTVPSTTVHQATQPFRYDPFPPPSAWANLGCPPSGTESVVAKVYNTFPNGCDQSETDPAEPDYCVDNDEIGRLFLEEVPGQQGKQWFAHWVLWQDWVPVKASMNIRLLHQSEWSGTCVQGQTTPPLKDYMDAQHTLCHPPGPNGVPPAGAKAECSYVQIPHTWTPEPQ